MALTGMALDVMIAVGAPHLDGNNGGSLLEPLVGLWEGRRAWIFGNGPSLIRGAGSQLGTGDIVIACNNAISSYPEADCWITSEAKAHLASWFWRQEDYPGLVVFDASMWTGIDNSEPLTEEMWLRHYDEDYLNRVVWTLRHGLDSGLTGSGWDTRAWRDGLFNYLPVALTGDPVSPYSIGEVVGGVAFCAAHLALIGGVSEILFVGCDFSWKEGQSQHADGSSPWSVLSDPLNQPIRVGDRLTTKFLQDSATALRWFLQEAKIPWRDLSGGLLSAGV